MFLMHLFSALSVQSSVKPVYSWISLRWIHDLRFETSQVKWLEGVFTDVNNGYLCDLTGSSTFLQDTALMVELIALIF